MLRSYPSVYQIGHKAIANLFDGKVYISEKIDGSQFSFGIIDGTLEARSKNKQLIVDAPEKMFTKAVEVIKTLPLKEGLTYRGEYLESRKHNTIAYDRIPNNHIILFDIQCGEEDYLSPGELREEAVRIGLEIVPQIFEGEIKELDFFKDLLEKESVLGGSKIEGIVVKNYSQFTQEKKAAMGKYVREDFKEENQKDWKASNPTGKDIAQMLVARYATEARWNKAIQHLRDAGKLEGTPRDIGLLIQEVPTDILKEHEEEIKDALLKHFWKTISRGVTAGLPQYYKDYLLNSALEQFK